MTFRENFIAVVKCGGKILREFDGVVKLPFGSEYTILLKNKEGRRAVVNIEIDGKDVLSGRQLVLDANSDLELKGFLEDNVVRNRFKFIQKTKEIVDYRGDRIDDGLIRVSFRFEKPVHERRIYRDIYVDRHYYPNNYWYPSWTYTSSIGTGSSFSSSPMGSITTSDAHGDCTVTNAYQCSTLTAGGSNCSMLMSNTPLPEEGITVKGSNVNQNFSSSYIRELEELENVIVLRLSGYLESGMVVKEKIVTSKKVTCSTCGRKIHSNMKFCSNCGTALV